MRLSSPQPVRALVVTVAAIGLLLGAAGWASADAVTTSTGQTLRVIVSAAGLDQPQLVAYGTARLSRGTATLASVKIRVDQGDPIPVDLDAQGRFRKGVVLAFNLTSVEVEAIATASDGTTVNAIVVIGTDGSVTRPASPDKSKRVTTMPNTGMSDPPTLGPIGLALVLFGSVLAWRNRRPCAV